MDYVPWDINYLKVFKDFVLKSIGNSVNIGIWVLAVIVGIYVVIRIVKRFSK